MADRSREYAVAVRNGPGLFKWLTVVREPQGDIYVNVPSEAPDRKLHVSYHASGQHHMKSFGQADFVPRKTIKPDVEFRGAVNVCWWAIAADEARTLDDPCHPEEFSGVFEIPTDQVSAERYRTYLSVDVVDVQSEPTYALGVTVIRRHVFQDAFPWLMITLYDYPDKFPQEN